MNILYEDNHLLVVDKPAGLLTQPTAEVLDSLEMRAKAYIKEKYQKPGNVFLGVVHRLDKPVSGIVLFAKTSKALSRLNAAVRDKAAKKIYHALVEGGPTESEGTLVDYLRHDDFRSYTCEAKHPDAKLARLHYQIMEKRGTTVLLEIVLETGRYHQIRCQCAAAGFPIVGDTKYGAAPASRLALHHVKLSIQHPVSQEMMSFSSSYNP